MLWFGSSQTKRTQTSLIKFSNNLYVGVLVDLHHPSKDGSPGACCGPINTQAVHQVIAAKWAVEIINNQTSKDDLKIGETSTKIFKLARFFGQKSEARLMQSFINWYPIRSDFPPYLLSCIHFWISNISRNYSAKTNLILTPTPWFKKLSLSCKICRVSSIISANGCKFAPKGLDSPQYSWRSTQNFW